MSRDWSSDVCSSDRLVSFAEYFPADKPQYSCIVSIRKPGLPASGGMMAGSVFGKIAERVYAKNLYLPLTAAVDSNSVFIPDVKAGNFAETRQVLSDLRVNTRVEGNFPRNQNTWSVANSSDNAVSLNERNMVADLVPNTVGMGAKDAVFLMESNGLKVRLNGAGKVYRTSLAQGSRIRRGQTVTLDLR